MNSGARIYVVLPQTVETPGGWVIQPPGRQAEQACHVTAKLRHELGLTTMDSKDGELTVPVYEDYTTIILAARDSHEMMHVYNLFVKQKMQRNMTFFSDHNPGAYGSDFRPITALAIYTLPKKTVGILDYLPLWDGHLKGNV